ncbi:MAG TPA: hypothetical protein VFN93_09470, partial [Gaiellaceae bacterium]|nr:hypothetical protein [Gaiellaceae bacterium]
VFEGSRILSTNRYGEAGPAPPGTFMSAAFERAPGELLNDEDPEKARRVMEAMLGMSKIEIEGLQRAYESA